MDTELIYEQATAARAALRAGGVPRELLAALYTQYDSAVEIDAFLDEAARIFPTGNCGLASVYLQHLYGIGSVRRGYYNGQRHTFLCLYPSQANDIIVDITADQFGGPKIYVGPLRAPWTLT